MATNFPGSLDSFTNPTGGDNLSTSVGGRTHSQMHADVNDAIEAIQADIGAGADRRWPPAAASGAGAVLPSVPGVTPTGTMVPSAGRVHFWPMIVERRVRLVGQSIQVTTAGTAASVVRVGIYASDSSAQPSGNPLHDTSQAGDSTGEKKITGLSIIMTPGIYWPAILVPTGTASPATLRACDISAPVLVGDINNGRRWRDSFPDVSYSTLPTGWSRAISDGWAATPNPAAHVFWFEEV